MVLLVVAVAAAAFGGAAGVKKWREAKREEAALKVVLAARVPVLAILKDPGSAQFRAELRQVDGSTVCGEINAKNSLGGYVGFKRYVSNGRNFIVEGGGFKTWPLNEASNDVPLRYPEALDLMEQNQGPGTTATQRASVAPIEEEIFAWYWKERCSNAVSKDSAHN